MKNLLKVLVLSSSIIALAACSTNKTPPPGAVPENAQAYGMGQKGGLTGSDVGGPNGGVRYVNPLTAPSTQVYYFAYDRSAVNPADLQAVGVQAGYLSTHKAAKIRLEGHTDDRGSREYNVALGDRRAKAVARILKQQGVAPSQITIVSYGKEKPAVVGVDENARSLNRRVVLIYINQ
jgi:peptidoglycan-associated lipoprotein